MQSNSINKLYIALSQDFNSTVVESTLFSALTLDFSFFENRLFSSTFIPALDKSTS